MQNIQTERDVACSPRSAGGRRKRIAERGSDRLALITGQIQTLPPLPPPPPRSSPRFHITPRHLRPESLPVELSQEFHPDLRTTLSFSIPAASEEIKESSRFSTRLRHQSGFKITRPTNFEITSDDESLFQDSDNTHAEPTKHQFSADDDAHLKSTLQTLSYLNAAPVSDDDGYSSASSYTSRRNNPQGGVKFSKRSNFHIRTKVKSLTQDSENMSHHEEVQEQEEEVVKSSSATPRAQIVKASSDGKKKKPKPVISFNPTLLSSREINSSIVASETFRAFCALIVAVVVVFCCMISEKIAAIRPPFIILLNDVTIVLARVYMEKIRATEEEGGEKVEANNNNEHGHRDRNGVKLLERGLVAYQAIRGIFIDISVYSLIIISCVSLMK